METAYSTEFFCGGRAASFSSASVVVPMVMDWVGPCSVVDVGCGTGEWLAVFKKCGVETIAGMDGPWIPKDQLQIPSKSFFPTELPKLASVHGGFDLVVSLEVAEHLPASAADHFVGNLTRLGPVVLFSAAVPCQGGNHFNEQWPEYWVERFENRGFLCADIVRERIWYNPKVAWWYAQNTLMMVSKSKVSDYPELASAIRSGGNRPLSVVHPTCYLIGMKNKLIEGRQLSRSKTDMSG